MSSTGLKNNLAIYRDSEGDTIMSDSSISPPPTSPFRDKFNLDWFSFDGKLSTPKSPTYSPVARSISTRNLSISTASPTEYFDESPVSKESATRNVSYLGNSCPPQVIYPPAPAQPLRWLWQCHLCHSRYALAVTRRCLVDGHYYCSGNSSTQRNIKKRRKHQSCTSEFDYVAWKKWGQWKRKTLALKAFANGKAEPRLMGCEGCISPSQCRYEKRRSVEIISFDEFVKSEDLIVNDTQELLPRRLALEKVLSFPVSDVPDTAGERESSRDEKTKKKTLRIDPSPASSPVEQRSSKRHRFYSSFAGNLSSRDSSPTSSSLVRQERGRFDPNLPSVTRISTDKTSDMELSAIESTLKSVLTSQRQNNPSQNGSQVSAPSATRSKRPLNSKIESPDFETIIEEAHNNVLAGGRSGKLRRNETQQSLLTDFFRLTRTTSQNDLGETTNSQGATREAEINAFLQFRSAKDDEQESSERRRDRSIHPSNEQHFEDISLSPLQTSSAVQALGEPTKDRMVSGDLPKNETLSPENESGSETTRLGLGFAFPSFVFGKK